MTTELQNLSDATMILTNVRVQCAGTVPAAIYIKVMHAVDYLNKQIADYFSDSAS